MSKLLQRRAILKSVMIGFGAAAFGEAIFACTSSSTSPKRGDPTPNGNNGDDDDTTPKSSEYVPGESTPVIADAPVDLPNQVYEARVKQLEDEQARVFRPTAFTAESPGTNKDAHVPRVTSGAGDGGAGDAGGGKSVKVVVNHVMGNNLLDGGYADSGSSTATDAGDGGDGGDAGDAGSGTTVKPQTHYITTIYIRGQYNGKDTVIGLYEFSETDKAPPTVIFKIPPGVTSVTAYEWCTLHGLWASDPFTV